MDDGGYTPFNDLAPINFNTSCLGAFNMGHPLMQGIPAGSLCAFFRHSVTLSAGAEAVALYADDEELCAFKVNAGQTGVGINAYLGENPNDWSGPYGTVIVNAGRWLLVCGPTPTPTPTCTPGGTPGAWSQATPYPIPDVRYGWAQTATHFYVFGGVSDGTRVNNVYRMDIATGAWQVRAPMPFTSEAPTCAHMESTGLVYCTEGDTGGGFASYNIATDSWTPLASPGGDHYGSASGAFNGKVFVAGGTTAQVNTVQVYDVATNTWSAGTGAPNDFLLAGYQQVGQYLYVVGGFHSSGPGALSSMLSRGQAG